MNRTLRLAGIVGISLIAIGLAGCQILDWAGSYLGDQMGGLYVSAKITQPNPFAVKVDTDVYYDSSHWVCTWQVRGCNGTVNTTNNTFTAPNCNMVMPDSFCAPGGRSDVVTISGVMNTQTGTIVDSFTMTLSSLPSLQPTPFTFPVPLQR